MRVRWSDVIAVSAISAGALFPVALRDAVRSHDPRFIQMDVRPHLVIEVQPEACVDEVVLDVLEERRDQIRTRVDQMRFEAARMRTEADLIRMSVARIEAENAMSDALARLEAQIAELETRLGSADVDAEDGKKKRKRRRGPPCRRPGRRHPGR